MDIQWALFDTTIDRKRQNDNEADAADGVEDNQAKWSVDICISLLDATHTKIRTDLRIDSDRPEDRVHTSHADQVHVKPGMDDTTVLVVVKQHGLGLRNATELTRVATNCARNLKIRCWRANFQR